MQLGPNRATIGICVFCLVWLGSSIKAGTDSDISANSSSAVVRFVVRIPELLSIRIADPDRPDGYPEQGTLSMDRSDTSPSSEQAIKVSVLGRVSAGGTMALTAERLLPPLSRTDKASALSFISWQANGVHMDDGQSETNDGVQNIDCPAAHTFTFSKQHPTSTGRLPQQILYTISSP